MNRTKILWSVVLAALISCMGKTEAISEDDGEKIALKKISEISMKKGIDERKLPRPLVERKGRDLIYDFKDEAQNVWIVVYVHPDRSAEMSFTKVVGNAR